VEQSTRDELLREIDRWLTAECEPSLDDLLTDPIIRLLMARDGVDEAIVRRLASEAIVLKQDGRMRASDLGGQS